MPFLYTYIIKNLIKIYRRKLQDILQAERYKILKPKLKEIWIAEEEKYFMELRDKKGII